MPWPFVGRGAYDDLLALMGTQRRIQDANLARERELHDAARAQLERLTEALATIASPPTALPMPEPSMDPKIAAQVEASARGDDALARMLWSKARLLRRQRPDVSVDAICWAIRFNEPLPDITAEPVS